MCGWPEVGRTVLMVLWLEVLADKAKWEYKVVNSLTQASGPWLSRVHGTIPSSPLE